MPRLTLLLSLPVCLGLGAVVPARPQVQPKGLAPAPTPNVAWPMYGGTPSRNMVNLHDRDVFRTFDPAKGLGLLWKAQLGSRSYAQPVVAGGRVFVGTNNNQPRNPRDTRKDTKTGEVEPIDKGVLMCFAAGDGKFLWQAVHDKLPSGMVNDWPYEGVCSIPTVVGDRVYYVSNQCRVVCLDAGGFADGNQGLQTEQYRGATDADVLWEFDMMKELNVFPHNMATGCPLVVGDLLFVPTSNGVDENHINIPSPDAPSFICLNRNTGRLVWKDNSPGKEIMHGQWASPSYAADPVPQVIFPGGDGWLRAFDPPTGKLLWKFDCNPKDAVYELGGTGTRSDFIAAPVVYDGRVYIGVGQDPEHTTGIAYFWCIDLKKAVERGATRADRDVSPELLLKSAKKPDGTLEVETAPNPASALAWSFGGEEKRRWAIRDFKFGRTLSTACVVDGIVYAAELHGFLHCLDAKTGKHFWQYDTKAATWGSPYYADGKVFLANETGELYVFRHDPKPEVIDELDIAAADRKEARVEIRARRKQVEDKYLMFKVELDAPVRGTPTVAGGRFYLATENTLYAFGSR
ncbi:MAG TPA: PQQ-binding-like beta-propeller repeat protein [Gemmata sp.]|nr:PQQ-binding-like beta-propeller repeat protein [Gemmata sp.]